MIKSEKEETLAKMNEFVELLQALLVGYNNLGMAAFKSDNLKFSI